MEAVINRTCPSDTYVVREVAVCSKQPAAAIALTAGIKMHNLPGCMHAGIGSTGTNDLDILVGDDCKGFFDASLHALTGTLTLPAVVGGAVVLQT
jgi:hypothetical protein